MGHSWNSDIVDSRLHQFGCYEAIQVFVRYVRETIDNNIVVGEKL